MINGEDGQCKFHLILNMKKNFENDYFVEGGWIINEEF